VLVLLSSVRGIPVSAELVWFSCPLRLRLRAFRIRFSLAVSVSGPILLAVVFIVVIVVNFETLLLSEIIGVSSVVGVGVATPSAIVAVSSVGARISVASAAVALENRSFRGSVDARDCGPKRNGMLSETIVPLVGHPSGTKPMAGSCPRDPRSRSKGQPCHTRCGPQSSAKPEPPRRAKGESEECHAPKQQQTGARDRGNASAARTNRNRR